jgi:hypothetical protein
MGRTTREGQNVIEILPYDAMTHRRSVRKVLTKIDLEEHHIAGQLAGLDALSGDPGRPATSAAVTAARNAPATFLERASPVT